MRDVEFCFSLFNYFKRYYRMNELKNVFASAIKDAGGKIDVATEFVARNMPELIDQAMRWYVVSSFALMVIGFIGVYLCIKYFKQFKSEDDAFEQSPPVLMGYVLWFVVSWMFILFNFAWIKILIAPKLWLIEFAANLVKQ